MNPTPYHYVYYPGHLGPRPVTELTADRGILWNAPVKKVRAEFALSLVVDGGFRRALDYDEAATVLDLSKRKLRELVKSGRLHAETYQPPREGEEAVPVIVLPAGLTVAAFKATLPTNERKEAADA